MLIYTPFAIKTTKSRRIPILGDFHTTRFIRLFYYINLKS
jgi:hypothetical protein